MKAAIIENGLVKNIAKVQDEDFTNTQGWIVSETARIGDSYDSETGDFTTPAPDPVPTPTSVPTWAAKIALIDFDLDVAAEAFIDGLTGKDKKRARVQWTDKQNFHRDNALIQAFKASQGMTDAELDSLFIYADQLAKEL